jgi:hypothetical protein
MTYKKAEVHVEEKDEDLETGENEKLLGGAKREGQEEKEVGGEEEEEEKKETRYTKSRDACLNIFSPVVVFARLIRNVLVLLFTWYSFSNIYIYIYIYTYVYIHMCMYGHV